MDCLVSIIVPCYNVDSYVDRCLDSLVNQSYANIEIIAVDDGSTDDTSHIIDTMSINESRIITIHKKNRGLSSARNTGLNECKGKYVLFVDGDDYLDVDAVEKLVQAAEKNEAPIVMFPYVREYPAKSIKSLLFDNGAQIFNTRDSIENLYEYLIGPGDRQKTYNPTVMDRLNTAWGKLYRTEVIGDIRFVNTSEIGVEDGYFNIEVFNHLLQANTPESTNPIIYTEDVFYHYEKSNGGSLLSCYKADYFEKRWNFYKRVKEILKSSKQEDLYINLSNRIALETFPGLVNLVAEKVPIKTKVKQLSDVYTNHSYGKCFDKLNFKKLHGIWKCFYWMLKNKHFLEVILLTNTMVYGKGLLQLRKKL